MKYIHNTWFVREKLASCHYVFVCSKVFPLPHVTKTYSHWAFFLFLAGAAEVLFLQESFYYFEILDRSIHFS